ncbi:MAG: glucosamine-6-phosphate deaminase [Candidatus Gracilibacteria bacterium]
MQLEYKPVVLKLKDPEEVAHFVVTQIMALINRKANAVMTIPTGKTPERMYRMLVEAVQEGKLDLNKATIRMLDEYQWLEQNDPRTFQNQLRRLLINPIHFPNTQFQTINSYPEKKTDPFEEADRYEALISATPADMAILGIGQNGHVGFNEPPARFTDRTRVVQLSDSTLEANKKDINRHGKYTPKFAITQGLGNILEANRIVLMATGKSKADIIRQTLKGEINTMVPSSALRTRQNVLFVLDSAAASLL